MPGYINPPLQRPASQIDRLGTLPLYHQLHDILRGKVMRGVWQPGDMIPAETELMAEHGVSRTTVRQVLNLLVQEGLIYRQQGRGSFVAHPAVEKTMTRIVSFTEDMRQRGFRPGTRVLVADLIAAPPGIAEQLRLPPGEELVRLVRLRLADGEPMAIEEANLVHRYCPGILEYDFSVSPLREVLDRVYRIRWSRAAQNVRAAAATREQARLLGVRLGAPLLTLERVSFSTTETPVEYLRTHYRGDRYVLYNELFA